MLLDVMANTAPAGFIASPTVGTTDLSNEALCARVAAMREQMLTVCAWTHQIKYEGEWMTPDVFLRRCFQIPVSHGIAPEVADQLLHEAPTSDLPAA